MPNGLRNRWTAFQKSYDAPEAAVQSSPGTILIGVGGLIVGLLVVGFFPAVAAASQMQHPLWPVCTAILGGLASYTAYRHGATGRVGTACMLLDTQLYAASFALASVLSTGTFSIAFAIALGLFLVTFPASVYSLTLLISLAMGGPPLILLLAFNAPASTWIIFWVSFTLTLATSYRTGQRRALAVQNDQLRNALGETSRVADECLDTAISASLVDVGRFLHELRNLQTLQRINLEFLFEEAKLDDSCVEALRDVMDARVAEEHLLTDALENIRNRVRPGAQSFELKELLASTIETYLDRLLITAHLDSAPSFQVTGNPEHLRLVIRNLLRNASQAGASRVALRLTVEEAANAVRLEVTDNGPGIPIDVIGSLFQPFTTAGKQEGTGLGLYLVKRYIELMGGRIEAANAEQGGARFSLRLPGRIADAASSAAPIIQRQLA